MADDGPSSSSSSSADPRVQRCARFTKEDDYERCVRLVRRMPVVTRASSSSAASSETGSDRPWQTLFGRMEAKIEAAVKLASTMGRKFCRAQTDAGIASSQECMLRLKTEMHSRMSKIIDEVFRGDLPSGR